MFEYEGTPWSNALQECRELSQYLRGIYDNDPQTFALRPILTVLYSRYCTFFEQHLGRQPTSVELTFMLHPISELDPFTHQFIKGSDQFEGLLSILFSRGLPIKTPK